jgi:hypothetical protein
MGNIFDYYRDCTHKHADFIEVQGPRREDHLYLYTFLVCPVCKLQGYMKLKGCTLRNECSHWETWEPQNSEERARV